MRANSSGTGTERRSKALLSSGATSVRRCALKIERQLNVTADTPRETADKVRNILESNCYRCHGKDGSAECGFDDVLDSK